MGPGRRVGEAKKGPRRKARVGREHQRDPSRRGGRSAGHTSPELTAGAAASQSPSLPGQGCSKPAPPQLHRNPGKGRGCVSLPAPLYTYFLWRPNGPGAATILGVTNGTQKVTNDWSLNLCRQCPAVTPARVQLPIFRAAHCASSHLSQHSVILPELTPLVL